jgi:hypothetical protein
MHRHRALGRAKLGQPGEEGLHRRRLGRHHRSGRLGRAGRIAGQSQHERPHPAAGRTVAPHLIFDRRERPAAVPRYGAG